ncbi:MAG: hypothetical protein QNJ23_03330 [Woeseiaceae bacterium]|nr:hypothetical protein [Woeseiaceae bacterium]
MIIKRMAQAIRRQDWFTVFVEILVVIVGLMLAFQLDRWWEQRGDRAQEAQYVARLIVDVQADIESLEYALELQSLRLDLATLLMDVVADPELAMRRPVEFLGAIVQSSYLYTPVLTAHTFEDLRSTGNMRLLRDPDIKNLLYDYYGYEADQRQFEAIWFPQELHHFKLAAGINSLEQERFIQDTWVFFRPDIMQEVRTADVDEDDLRATLDRFLSRQEFVDWLPQTRNMQQLQIRRNESILEKARSLQGRLTEYLASIQT